MPVLDAEPHVFPDCLFSQIEQGGGEDRWWVLHVRPRTEKAIARKLKAQGESYFLPMGKTRRFVQRRWVEAQLPLFPGYFFLYGKESAYHRALMTNKVVSSLTVDDQPRLHEDLSRLNRLLEANASISLHPKITVGNQVEITTGSLVGLKGVVVRCDGETRFIIEVKMLNQQVSAQIDGCLLRKL